MELKLKYVSREWARTKWRYRFQRNGRKATLPGKPGEPEFMRRYAELMDEPIPERTPIYEGSIAWLVGLFIGYVEMQVSAGIMSPLTLKGHRHHLGRLVDAHGPMSVEMRQAHLLAFLDRFATTPSGRDNLKKSVSAMYEWAIKREHVTCPNPAKGIAKLKPKTAGFYTCTAEDVAKYLAHHGPGTMARRCMILVLSTVARREDLRNLGPANEFERDGQAWLRWTQSKAPNDITEIPMLAMLREEVEGCTSATYLTNAAGKPYTHGTLGNAVQRWFTQADAKGSLHGVRKGVPSILTAMGATSYELDVLLGHKTGSKETRTYVEAARRAEIAAQMSLKMEGVKW